MFNRDARNSRREGRDQEDDQADCSIAAPPDVEPAEHGVDLIARRPIPPGGGGEAESRDGGETDSASHEAALQPKTKETALELARDETIVGAHEMQDLDHLTVAGHGALRREGDGKAGGDQDE